MNFFLSSRWSVRLALIVIALLAAVWFGALDTPLYYLNNIVWELLGKGTGYIDKIAYSIYYAGLGTVV